MVLGEVIVYTYMYVRTYTGIIAFSQMLCLLTSNVFNFQFSNSQNTGKCKLDRFSLRQSHMILSGSSALFQLMQSIV